MNPAHVHLILNHIPLICIGFTLLLLIIALVRRSRELMNIALVFAVLVALFAIPVYLTGEPAEELVEDQPGVSETIIDQHRESAEISFVFVEITGALALVTLFAMGYTENYGKKLAVLTLLMLIVSSGLMVWTANRGGKINHPEIRNDFVGQGSTGAISGERDEY